MASEVFDRPAPDPGNSTSRLIALVIAIALGGVLIILQNTEPVRMIFEPGPNVQRALDGEDEQEAEPAAVVPPSAGDPFSLAARFAVQSQDTPEWFRGEPEVTMQTLDGWAYTPENRVRAAIVAGELIGPERAVERLDELIDESTGRGGAAFAPDAPLGRDIADLLAIYSQALSTQSVDAEAPDAEGASGESSISPVDDGVITEASAERLRTHHGFFAEVALTTGLDDSHPDREPLVTGGEKLAAMIFGIGGGLLLVFGVGFCLFIAAIVLISMQKIRSGMGTPEPGGSVFLEAFALFAGGFLLLMLSLGLLANVITDETTLTVVQVGGQWLLLACPLWPLIRGMKWHTYRRAIGWHGGKGVFREIGAGVVGYLAGLPLFAMGLGISLALVGLVTILREALELGDPPPPTNPIFDLATSDNPAVLVMVFLLATVWAPLCEESIFRGALYRHMRGRAGIVVCAIGSALIFGLCHQYGPVLVFPVVILGVNFALLREWRGSLIAPITAHALHNGTVAIMAYSVIRLIS
jgi:membrane protease YdiL (CAAX protease family)